MPSGRRDVPATTRIALVTHEAGPGLTPDDGLLAQALEARRAETAAMPWSQPADWESFDAILLRSAWDYHLRFDAFMQWIGRLERRRALVMNPAAMIRWNGDKRYLLELARTGVEIVPTELEAGGPGGEQSPGDRDAPLAAVLARRGWTDAVVKPAVSASAHSTWRTSSGDAAADEPRFRRLVAESPRGVLVQQFMPEVLTEGEWSLVFIEGEFSHAASKRPRRGDFRVQHEHGGQYAPADPPPEVIADAARALAAGAARAGVTRRSLAYARVDGVVRERDGIPRLVLMELECIEPNLFFLQAPDAADRLADTVVRHVLANVGEGTYLR